MPATEMYTLLLKEPEETTGVNTRGIDVDIPDRSAI